MWRKLCWSLVLIWGAVAVSQVPGPVSLRGPVDVALDSSHRRVVVLDMVDNTLNAVDLSGGPVQVLVSLGPQEQRLDPRALELRDGMAYVVGRIGRLLAVDLDTGAARVITDQLRVAVGVALLPDGQTALVTELGGTLARVDLASGQIQRLVRGLVAPTDVAVTADGTAAVVADNDGDRLVVVDLQGDTLRVVGAGLDRPAGVALASDGQMAYVVEQLSGRLVQVDLSSDSSTTVLTGLSFPVKVILNPENTLAYVVERGSELITEVNIDPNSPGFGTSLSLNRAKEEL
ncbi:MAG: YncE family protein [Deinococcus sp.]|nr:YncE family protein [Deinococcus sp.]